MRHVVFRLEKDRYALPLDAVREVVVAPERYSRVLNMVAKMDELGFGNCTNQYECSAVCPKLISHDFIARMNRDYLVASVKAAFTPVSNASGGGAG